MGRDRLFTDAELKEMGTRTLDLVLQAIDEGDKKKAKELAVRMYGEFNHLHDGYMFWVTGLQSYIYRNYGIDAVERAEREAHTIEGKTVFLPLRRPTCGRGWNLRLDPSGATFSRSLSRRTTRRSW